MDPYPLLDIQGIEPWTSRMRSERATTVPNARLGKKPSDISGVARKVLKQKIVGSSGRALLD